MAANRGRTRTSITNARESSNLSIAFDVRSKAGESLRRACPVARAGYEMTKTVLTMLPTVRLSHVPRDSFPLRRVDVLAGSD